MMNQSLSDLEKVNELILEFQKEKEVKSPDQSKLSSISEKIISILEDIPLEESDFSYFQFILESLIDLSNEKNPILTFDKIIQTIYSNEYLYDAFYKIPKSLYPKHAYDDETNRIIYFFEQRKTQN